jgi:hypothetical protein
MGGVLRPGTTAVVGCVLKPPWSRVLSRGRFTRCAFRLSAVAARAAVDDRLWAL